MTFAISTQYSDCVGEYNVIPGLFLYEDVVYCCLLHSAVKTVTSLLVGAACNLFLIVCAVALVVDVVDRHVVYFGGNMS